MVMINLTHFSSKKNTYYEKYLSICSEMCAMFDASGFSKR